ncbi:hypothetical protein EST38_g3858 [Candolleomyces aberdarensis]|uniref:DUF6589 domain-containing protein n=1 Tax=Candolleomyces aberdarensis TaxID=2316362 RepID=A0A4Q2DR28_9AGAR|nr:hypothetical protein EST38_g3858 [Candolleomyces aberdarensis]
MSVDRDNPQRPAAGPSTTRKRAPKKAFVEKASEVLSLLSEAGISPFELVSQLLDGDNDMYRSYRAELYKDTNKRLSTILDLISGSKPGRAKLKGWLKGPIGTSVVGSIIHDEMDELRSEHHLKGLADIDLEYIKDRELPTFVDDAPFTMELLRAAAQTNRQAETNVKKSPEIVCDSIMRQLLYQRSNRCLGFGTEFGLYLWATGSARATIEAIHNCGLSVCYQSVLNSLDHLANHCMTLAATVGSGLHAFCYDNINLSTSIHVEQRGLASTPGKVTSGTLGIIYKLPNATPENMALQPILDRMRDPNYKGLDFSRDLIPTDEQYESILHQFKVHVINVLFSYCKGLNREDYSDESLKPKPRRPFPPNHKTEFFPIRISTKEEASIHGNLMYHDEVYLTMLQRAADELSKWAIASINDQHTNSCIRSGQILRSDDLNNYHRRLVFQLGMGLFHAALNLAWALLNIHRGILSQKASLTWWFAILEKTRLGQQKPDYHTLYATLIQILEGVVLSAWKELCRLDGKTLEEYAALKPKAEELHEKAATLLTDYLTPIPLPYGPTAGSSDEETVPVTSTRKAPPPTVPPAVPSGAEDDPSKDQVHQNLRLLVRDVLYLLELVAAVKDGDFGRVEDILPHLAMIYRGAGSNNYCTECLFMIQNLKYIWTPEFGDIMRDTMIVNPSGIPGHGIATDINMEYTVRDVKDLIIAKGLQSTWDRVGDISAAIAYLKEIKRKMGQVLTLPHQNKGHSDVDVSHLVWRIVDKIETDGLLIFTKNRRGNAKSKATPDLLLEGEKKLKSSTLSTFNKKFKNFVAGQPENCEDELGSGHEADSLPPLELTVLEEPL